MRLGLVPPRVEAFCLLAVAGKVSTVDNVRRALTSNSFSDICVMCGCGKEESSINHLFHHCEVATFVWSNLIWRCGLAWCCPKNIANMEESWLGGCFVGVRPAFMEDDSFGYLMAYLEGKK